MLSEDASHYGTMWHHVAISSLKNTFETFLTGKVPLCQSELQRHWDTLETICPSEKEECDTCVSHCLWAFAQSSGSLLDPHVLQDCNLSGDNAGSCQSRQERTTTMQL